MQQSTATRRLVKSPPELWAEVSSGTVEPTGGIPGPPLPAPDPSPPRPAPDPSPLPPAPDPVPPTPAPTPPAPQIEILDPGRTAAILAEMLDDLGSAHRPFSRG